jgi:hypothetical protein
MVNRREFIKMFSRIFMLAGLSGMSVYLSTRKPAGDSCGLQLPCRQCKKFVGCKDQKALAEQDHQNRSEKK